MNRAGPKFIAWVKQQNASVPLLYSQYSWVDWKLNLFNAEDKRLNQPKGTCKLYDKLLNLGWGMQGGERVDLSYQ